jgi:hypothetical protein
MPCPSSVAPFTASHGEAPAAEVPPGEAAATTAGEAPLTEAEEALEAPLLTEEAPLLTEEAPLLTEGDADGLAAVLRTAPPQQQGLMDEFLALCANEALFPRRVRGAARCASL